MSKFTFVELFAGIGGVSFGFEKVGGKCVLAAEYDPERAGKRQFAQEAYKLLHPSVPVVGDVFELKGEDVPDHDLLSFTFPCQSFSVAGKRGGFEDARGTLYFEAMRIAREKKPKIIFAENVKGLVNHDKGKTLDTIIQVANDSGYVVDYEILNSKFFGVPQNRERWFMVGVREDLIEAEPWNIEGNTIIPKSKKRIGEWAKTFNFEWPAQDSVTTRLRDILETEVDEKYYLDDEKTAKLVAQLERKDDNIIIDPSQSKREGKPREYVGISPTITAREYKEPRMVAQLEAKKPDERMSRQAIETFNESEQPKEHGDVIQAYNRQHLKDGICPTLTTRPEGFKTASLPIVESEPHMLGHVDLKRHDAIKRVYDVDYVGPTLTTMGGGHREPKIAEAQVDEKYYLSDDKTAMLVAQLEGSKECGAYGEISYVGDLKTQSACAPKSFKEAYGVLNSEGITHTIQTMSGGNREPKIAEFQGLPNGLPIREATKQGYAMAAVGDAVGDAVNFQFPDSKTRRGRVGKQIANTLEASNINQGVVEYSRKTGIGKERDVALCLSSSDWRGLNRNQNQNAVFETYPKYRIRKLTPKECFRLQAFPDEAHDALEAAGISNSQRYKMAGNAVTVSVIEAIGERLVRFL